jgi:Ca-activated chloride channel family protein
VRARLTHDFTHDATALAGTLILAEAKGRTALYDAVYLGVLKAQEGHNTRKALLVISDGMDNSSRYTSTEVKRLLEESDVAIYTLFMSEPGRFGVSGPSLWNLGERVYTPTSEEDLVDICQQIARDLHQQYSIGYYPTSHARDGKWHDLRIKIASPPGLPKLTAVAKAGYRAPSR